MPRDTKAESKSCISEEEKMEVRRGPWTPEEDSLLIHYITNHGGGHWNLLAKSAGLRRTGKSCRLRWLNYLKPDIKRGNLTTQEQLLILQLHYQWGNRWSKIAQHLPGRTDNEIKNFWRTRVQKHARQLKIDANSNKFFDAIGCLWTPTLVQKVERNSVSSSSLSSPSNHNLSAASISSSPQVTSFSSYPFSHEYGNSVQDNAPQDARESNHHVDCSGYVMEDHEISGTHCEIPESDQWVVLDSIEDNLWNMENM